MTDFSHFSREFAAAAERIDRFLKHEAPVIMGQQALEFIGDNFDLQGFQGAGGVEAWAERKYRSKSGSDKRYYQRGSKAGRLTRFGQKEKGRAILVGHDTGGDNMVASFAAEASPYRVEILNDKKYAHYHNEGTEDHPRRAMIDPSPVLDEQVERTLDHFFKQFFP